MAILTEEQQHVAVSALATTLGKPASEIETMLAGDTPTDVDKLVTERIKTVRKEGKDGGKGELQKIANRKAKELFGTETTDVDTIEGLLDAVKTGYKPAADPASLTEEQVKTHPAFRDLEKSLQTKETEHQKALETARAEGEAKATRYQLTAKAIKALSDFGAVISEDPKIAAVQERMFLEQLEGVSQKEVEGKPEFWKDGKRIENDKLFPVAESDFFKGLVEKTYTTKVSDQRNSPGLPPNAGGNPGGNGGGAFTHFKGTPPKTQDEYNAILRDRDANSYEAREEVSKFWADAQPK